jgi:hypothetical protein
MMILRNNIFGFCFDSAIDELIVIRICFNQFEAKIYADVFGICAVKYGLNDIPCYICRTGTLRDNLLVFIQNLIRKAQAILSGDKIPPDRIVNTISLNGRKETIGI